MKSDFLTSTTHLNPSIFLPKIPSRRSRISIRSSASPGVRPDPWSLSDGNPERPKPRYERPKHPLSDDDARRIIKKKAQYLSTLRRNQGSHAMTPKWIKRTPEQMVQYLEDDRNGQMYGKHVVAAIKTVRGLSQKREGSADMRVVMGSFVAKLTFRDMCVVLKEQRGWRQVRDFFAWMKLQLSYRPSVVVYTIVLRLYGQVGKIKLAEETFLEMLEVGCEPDAVACGTMLCTYARWGRHNAMLTFYKAVQERRIVLSTSVYNFMLSSLQKKSLHEKVIDLWLEMVEEGVPPTEFTYTVVVSSYAKQGFNEDALQVFGEMKSLGFVPEEVTYSSVISLSVKAGDWDQAVRLYEDMRSQGITPSNYTCASMLSLYYRTENYPKALSLFRSRSCSPVKTEAEREKEKNPKPPISLCSLFIFVAMNTSQATRAALFLNGSNRQTTLLQRSSTGQLWGSVRFHSPQRLSLNRAKAAGLRCSAQTNKPGAAVSTGSVVSVEEQPSLVEKPAAEVIHFYRVPLIQESANAELLKSVQTKISNQIVSLTTEQCFNIGLESKLEDEKLSVLKWILQETFEPENLGTDSFLEKKKQEGLHATVVEVGPRLSFTTAWSTNAVSICRACGLNEVTRLERSRRYLLFSKEPLLENQVMEFAAMVHDRMTECVYSQRLTSFETNVVPEEVKYVPVMEKGRKALEEINQEMGLAFDEQDLQYYTRLFKEDIQRNPTNVELFDIAQSNSEHSRHWFFAGKIVIDGKPMDRSLMQIVKSTWEANKNNSVIGFHDNSSAMRGFLVNQLRPLLPGSACLLDLSARDLDILFTAETHNFPCAVAPYPGAETGAGGRIRDTHATGRGSFVVASTSGYCVGNLNMEGSYAPWEDSSFQYPPNLASPLKILIDASNGASDYGNKFGEPMIQGYTRTFGMRLPSGDRREWLKPIMFSAGIGQIDHTHITKGEPEVGMLVVKIGGPAYRIGMGGGAASSMASGQNDAELDFNAVQRGDAEMAQKLYRVVRTCIEMGEKNPIISIHDQGAGGNCNVVKEIIYPKGAEIDIRAVVVGDHTMSVLEIWGAEYQEQDAILVKAESREILQSICKRERLSMAVIGTINGEGRCTLIDSTAAAKCSKEGLPPPPPAVDFELEKVLGDMPKKTFEFNRVAYLREPLDIAPGITLMDSLKRVLRLPSVSSKRFLTTKVDRCVTGLVAQQQTVGPLQITLADVAVIAQTYTDLTGGACAIGEQPIKGLLDPKAMARLAVGEALTNLVWAKVTALSDVKASGNWMYAAKFEGEGPAMYDAAIALSEAMIKLGIAIDGGKDSLSMAALADGEAVKAPGNLVISAYVTCQDITKTVTPDLKLGDDDGVLVHVDLAKGKRRLGGSALAQVFGQIGNDCPDLDDVPYLKNVFEGVQALISENLVSAGHDISDGGLVVTALEMAFAGNRGINLNLASNGISLFETLFSEELGLVMEISSKNLDTVMEKLRGFNVTAEIIGTVTDSPLIEVKVDGITHLSEKTSFLRDMWEDTSFQLEKLQRLASCVDMEKEGLKLRHEPNWKLSFTPSWTNNNHMSKDVKPKVAVIREEGSNGDREMSAAFYAAGFEPWDVTVSDLLAGSITLDQFRGIVFVGGFSYADVLDSAKGWAASIRFNEPLLSQFQEFYKRPDTFSLGICNGCQLMALLGWVPGPQVGGSLDTSQPRFVHNESGRFECRFTSVTIKDSPSIMLKGMEGSTLGVWAAHGEGRAYFPDEGVLDNMLHSDLAPLRYCDDDGSVTEAYPFNLNGSPLGIAAICSPDGRHLAMMPHPERCFLMWQFPWYPKSWEVEKAGPSPWLKMFQNARDWCSQL